MGKNKPYSVLVQMHKPEYNCFSKLKRGSRINAYYQQVKHCCSLCLLELLKLCEDWVCSYIEYAPSLQ